MLGNSHRPQAKRWIHFIFTSEDDKLIDIMTSRLRIVALNEKQLKLAILDFNQLERNLNLMVTDKNIGEREKAVYKIRLNDMQAHLDQYAWFTPWMLIDKSMNRIIGAIMIKNYPNEKGEVVIGYAMQEEFRRKGYMREGVEGLVKWIFTNPEVKAIIADTLISNEASGQLLEQIGMEKYKNDGKCIWWRLPNLNL